MAFYSKCSRLLTFENHIFDHLDNEETPTTPAADNEEAPTSGHIYRYPAHVQVEDPGKHVTPTHGSLGVADSSTHTHTHTHPSNLKYLIPALDPLISPRALAATSPEREGERKSLIGTPVVNPNFFKPERVS